MLGGFADNSENLDYIDKYLDLDDNQTDDDIINFGKICRYRYKVSITAKIEENKKTNVKAEEIKFDTREITDFIIEHDYIHNFYPILHISLTIKTHVYKKIQNTKNTVKFKIRFSKYEFDEYDEIEGTEELIFENYFQPLFTNILISTTGDTTTTETEDTSAERRRQLDLYLFEIESVNNNKKILNFIANNCTPKNAIGYILNEVGVKKAIMEIPTVTKEYDQIIIPPKNFKNAIQTISEQYGIFNNGMRQYMDFDRYYLLDNNINKKVPVEKGEYPNVYINVVDNTASGSLKIGSYSDKDNKSNFINTANNVSASTAGPLQKEVVGSKIRVYERSELESAMTYDEDSKKFNFKTGYVEQTMKSEGYSAAIPSGKETNEKITYAYNSNELQSTRDEVTTQSQFNNLDFSLIFIDIDISFLTINKRYIFRFKNLNLAKIYNGVYMIDKMINAYNCSDKSVYTMCRFLRIE